MKWSKPKSCENENCGYFFESVSILYGTSAFIRCPACGEFNTLELKEQKVEVTQ